MGMRRLTKFEGSSEPSDSKSESLFIGLILFGVLEKIIISMSERWKSMEEELESTHLIKFRS